MLQNDFLDAKIGVDTAENEPSKACSIWFYFGFIWSSESFQRSLELGALELVDRLLLLSERLHFFLAKRMPSKKLMPQKSSVLSCDFNDALKSFNVTKAL